MKVPAGALKKWMADNPTPGRHKVKARGKMKVCR